MTEKQQETVTSEVETETLTPEEQAFFESGGESEAKPAGEEPKGDETPEDNTGEGEKPSDGEQEQARDEKGKFVPHQALHAEREEHKKTRSELQELKEFRARMEERMQWFEKTTAKPEEKQEDTPPDPNEDVFKALKWTQDKLLASEKEKQEARTQQEQVQREQEQERAVWNHWESAAQQYSQQNPDFANAAKWLSETRDKQLQAIPDARFKDVRARNQQIEVELKQIVVAAAQQQMNPAEAVYQIAQSYGYTPQEAAQAAEEATGGNDDLSEKIKRLESAQNASKTVGNAAGKAGGDEITAESLASMPEDEFNRWVAVPENARRFEKMMGG